MGVQPVPHQHDRRPDELVDAVDQREPGDRRPEHRPLTITTGVCQGGPQVRPMGGRRVKPCAMGWFSVGGNMGSAAAPLIVTAAPDADGERSVHRSDGHGSSCGPDPGATSGTRTP